MAAEAPAQRKSIHPETQVGQLSLTISDLKRSLEFYTNAIGFQILDRTDTSATLGAGGKPLLTLEERKGADAWPRGGQSYTGLYHFAILLPSRTDLGAWIAHWLDLGHPIGQGDHGVSEALYLEDPDMHGIEIYRDRPRSDWRKQNGQILMGTGPVDIKGMIEEAAKEGVRFKGLPAGTKLGHMHLQVGDIPEAEKFYCRILGFDIVASMPSALFVSAGGYHHHIGMNTWHSQAAGQPPDSSVKLKFFTVELPSEEARQEVLERADQAGVSHSQQGEDVILDDPWDNRVLLQLSRS
jgi:catechol 2,3-dioxygenase